MSDILKSTSVFTLAAIVLLLLASSCSQSTEKPTVDSETYRQVVSDFYVSLAAMKSDKAPFAVKKMKEIASSYPQEPAFWANLGVYAMRQGNFDRATEQLNKALDRSDSSSEIHFLAGILESQQGNVEKSLEHLNQAAKLDSSNLKVLFKLTEELERQNSAQSNQRIKKILDRMLSQHPNNLAVLAERIRVALKSGEKSDIQESLQKLEQQSATWPQQIQQQFTDFKSKIQSANSKDATFELALLRNSLNQLPQFQHDLRKVQLPANQIGFLMTDFLWLPNTNRSAEELDDKLKFTIFDEKKWSARLYKPIPYEYEKEPLMAAIEVTPKNKISFEDRLIGDFPGESSTAKLPTAAIQTIDYNYDFVNDIVLAGEGGLKLLEQDEGNAFFDVTDSLEVPASVTDRPYYGSWKLDIELDGDLDLLLSARDGSSKVLRNNGDGTFEVQSYFAEAKHIRNLLWADFDTDGDPDVVLLTKSGDVHYYQNERSGKFLRDTSFTTNGAVQAITYGDINNDGTFEIISRSQSKILSTKHVGSTGNWQTDRLLTTSDSVAQPNEHSALFITDLDNNGGLDLLASEGSETKLWLSDEELNLIPHSVALPVSVYGIADANGDRRLDIWGLNADGKQVRYTNKGAKPYKGQMIYLRASGRSGDQRINSFGIGGEVETRSGLKYQKQPINEPWIHLGVGTSDSAEVVRVLWPNGSNQTEFAELGYKSTIRNVQILKGSCPWVMTYNGEEMQFVTDFIWRTSLGLRINDQGTADVIHSIDWIKIEGDELKPRNGYYDVRITADLWESHFFDQVTLMAVDHPKDTEVFVDERFKLPAPKHKLYPMKAIYPIKKAIDQNRKDVTELVKHKDGDFVDTFELTPHQGVAKEHYIELDVGDSKESEGSPTLLAHGWVYPTDTSINVAISQGEQPKLYGIRVKVPNGEGGWKTVQKDIGFPSGKSKTMLVDLEGIFEPDTDRKVRLYTNMEVYWDQIRLGIQDADARLNTQKILPGNATLRYRGFSKMEQTDRFSPTVPNYQELASTTPKWRDLAGFYTRYGKVKELTAKTDDRYVIMNSGDELLFRFPELEAPPQGWERNFVLIGDGWIKDGDLNTGYSKKLLPLPYHGLEDYSKEPGLLQDDPAYQMNKQDWVNYHTRYVAPYGFSQTLKFEE